eukprot:scaffold336_cov384-Prasinococcus_capsulatus_cf.AAC.2
MSAVHGIATCRLEEANYSHSYLRNRLTRKLNGYTLKSLAISTAKILNMVRETCCHACSSKNVATPM